MRTAAIIPPGTAIAKASMRENKFKDCLVKVIKWLFRPEPGLSQEKNVALVNTQLQFPDSILLNYFILFRLVLSFMADW